MTYSNFNISQIRESYMFLLLVGENNDKARSHYLSSSGQLVQLMRGIYVEAGSGIKQIGFQVKKVVKGGCR